jgi:hypothetical protein
MLSQLCPANEGITACIFGVAGGECPTVEVSPSLTGVYLRHAFPWEPPHECCRRRKLKHERMFASRPSAPDSSDSSRSGCNERSPSAPKGPFPSGTILPALPFGSVCEDNKFSETGLLRWQGNETDSNSSLRTLREFSAFWPGPIAVE